MIELFLITLVVFFSLALSFFFLLLFLSFVFELFNWLERKMGELPTKLLFGLSGIAGFLLLVVGWFKVDVLSVQAGAFLITLSALYLLSESVKPLT